MKLLTNQTAASVTHEQNLDLGRRKGLPGGKKHGTRAFQTNDCKRKDQLCDKFSVSSQDQREELHLYCSKGWLL